MNVLDPPFRTQFAGSVGRFWSALTKTLSRFEPRKAMLRNVLLGFWVLIRNLRARQICSQKTVLLGGFDGVLPNRLAENPNNISNLRRQQDGKTVSLSKKGHIHMRAHAHVHGPSKSEKSVFPSCTPSSVGRLSAAQIVDGIGITDTAESVL